MEVYNQALGSKTATTIWVMYYILVFHHIILNLFVFSSRILWSFARDCGVPYPNYVSRLKWSNPVRATDIMLFLQIIIGILYIASKTVHIWKDLLLQIKTIKSYLVKHERFIVSSAISK